MRLMCKPIEIHVVRYFCHGKVYRWGKRDNTMSCGATADVPTAIGGLPLLWTHPDEETWLCAECSKVQPRQLAGK